MEALKEFKQMLLTEHEVKYPDWPEHLSRFTGTWTDRTANGLTKMIIKFLQMKGWQAERINNMGKRVDNRKVVTNVLDQKTVIGSVHYIPSTMTKGTADISATIAGNSVKIEVKIKDKQSPNQKKYQEMIEKAGGTYTIARTFQGFVEWYQAYLAEIQAYHTYLNND